MKHTLALVLMVFGLVGCEFKIPNKLSYTFRAQVEQPDLSLWVNKNIDDLVQYRGLPTSSFQMADGKSYYEWVIANDGLNCKQLFLVSKAGRIMKQSPNTGICISYYVRDAT
jgi:hypothetical protein